ARRPVHHLRERHPVPADGPGDGGAARAPGLPGRVPARADVLRAAARQLGLSRPGGAARAAVREGLRRPGLRRDRLPVGVVRGDGPRPVRPARGVVGRCRACGRGGGRGAARVGALAVPGREAGRGGRRRLLPPSRDLPPDVPLPAPGARGGGAAAAAAQRPRPGARGAARRDDVLRVRRDVRREEPGDVGGDARRQARVRAAHGRGGLRGAGQLLPAAHRRRAVALAGRGAARAPGGDPGEHGGL
ncbi:MAG: Predicted L-lactate dehydrogenase, Fe-S oxidoreductase subunit YkgE, partial [uncultured Solirubrobacteraceae bacterium]